MRILLPPALSCSFRAICFAMAAVFLHPFNAVAQTQPVAASRTADTFSSGVANEWFSLAIQLVQQTPGFSPPVASRALGYLGSCPQIGNDSAAGVMCGRNNRDRFN